MDIKVCCDEMKENIKDYVIELSGHDKPEIQMGDDFGWTIEISYCPWCGKKIEIIDKASLGYAGDQNAPIPIVYTVDGEEHICSPS